MWNLKNSKDLLDNLQSRSFSQVSSIKTLDFSTLCITLRHDKLKTRLKETIHKVYTHRNYGSKFVVSGTKRRAMAKYAILYLHKDAIDSFLVKHGT
jgi:hypothetical protein